MTRDDMETNSLNVTFDGSEEIEDNDDMLENEFHWRPVARLTESGEKVIVNPLILKKLSRTYDD